MYKILILAYLITQDPIATQQTFQMEKTFDTMEDKVYDAVNNLTVEDF